MSLTYKGWIPNVLGNLSFKLIGHSGHPFPFISTVDENKDKLSLCCIQKRIPNDYQIPLPIAGKLYLYISTLVARFLKKENIESTYVMLSSGQHDKTGTVQTISGTIYHILKKTQSAQKKAFNETLSYEDSTNDKAFINFLEEEAFFICDININRQGICELTARKTDESKYSSDPEENKATIKALIDQSYYFIKDAFHSHKHHNHSEDSLISTHLVDNSPDSWSDKTLKNLYRYILHQRSLLDRKLLGIFSYIRTFEKIIKLESEQENKAEQKNLFDRTISLEQLENSVKTAIEAKEKKVEFKRWFIGITFIFSNMIFFYIFASNSSLSDTPIKSFINQHTGFIISISALILSSVVVFTENIKPLNWLISLRLSNLVISLFKSKKTIALFFASLGAIFIGLFYYLISL